ncbi:MAG: oxidoreductase [Capsulimonadaceae bacterium]
MKTAPALEKTKPRFATVWLAGCSGCHMSFLDVDEWIIELADLVDIVFTPIADIKDFPENVDIVLVEGAVANDENLEMLKKARANSRVLIAFGDCAVTGNVTALRNPLGTAHSILHAVYSEMPDLQPQIPSRSHIVPVLLDQVQPIHVHVDVDRYIHGCPPSAAIIREAIEAALGDSVSVAGATKFG